MAPIVISASGDLTLVVTELDKSVEGEGDQWPIKGSAEFKVSREVLIEKSTYFKTMLQSDSWQESGQDVIRFPDENISRMRVILSFLHGYLFFEIKLKEIWSLVQGIDFYKLKSVDFKSWFNHWLQINIDQLKQRKALLYPTWQFDNAAAFTSITKFLIYNEVGHISEQNPSTLYQYRLPSRVIQQLNAAKGRLRVLLCNGLLKPNEALLEAKCDCRKCTLYDYEHHLSSIKVWPLEKVMRTSSVREVLDRLEEKFSFEPAADACRECQQSFRWLTKKLVEKIRDYCDGLCLDCMDRSKSKLDDYDADYWAHDSMDRDEWSKHCRVKHGEPTWYFSFMGRPDKMKRFRERVQDNDDFWSLVN